MSAAVSKSWRISSVERSSMESRCFTRSSPRRCRRPRPGAR
jgi:hypothetical protein